MPNIIILIVTGVLSTLLFFNFEKESKNLTISAEKSQIIQSRLIKVEELFSDLEYIILSYRFESKNIGLDKIPIITHDIKSNLEALENSFFLIEKIKIYTRFVKAFST